MNINNSYPHQMMVDYGLYAIVSKLDSYHDLKKAFASELTRAQKQHLAKQLDAFAYNERIVLQVMEHDDHELLGELADCGLNVNMELSDELTLLDYAKSSEMVAVLGAKGFEHTRKDSKYQSVADRLWLRYSKGETTCKCVLEGLFKFYKDKSFNGFYYLDDFLYEADDDDLIYTCVENDLLLANNCELALMLINSSNDDVLKDITNDGCAKLLFHIFLQERIRDNARKVITKIISFWKKDPIAEMAFAAEQDEMKALAIWALMRANRDEFSRAFEKFHYHAGSGYRPDLTHELGRRLKDFTSLHLNSGENNLSHYYRKNDPGYTDFILAMGKDPNQKAIGYGGGNGLFTNGMNVLYLFPTLEYLITLPGIDLFAKNDNGRNLLEHCDSKCRINKVDDAPILALLKSKGLSLSADYLKAKSADKTKAQVFKIHTPQVKPSFEPISLGNSERELFIAELLNAQNPDLGLSYIKDIGFNEFFEFFFSRPEHLGRLIKMYFHEVEVNIGRFSPIVNSWSMTTNYLLKRLNASHLDNADQDLKKSHFDKLPPAPVSQFQITGQVVKKLGRTLIVSSSKDQEWHAYKVRRLNEKKFTTEASVTQAYNKLPSLFKSGFHTPLGVYSTIEPLPPEMQTDSTEGDINVVYHYRAIKEYFTYPQEMNDEDFKKSSLIWVHDGAVQLKQGIYHENVGLFHFDNRRYCLFIDLLNNLRTIKDSVGAGGINHYRQTLDYPNLRANGLADLGDSVLLEDVLQNPRSILDSYHSLDFFNVQTTDENRAYRSLVLQMNGFGRVMLGYMLLTADLWYRSGKMDWQNEEECSAMGLRVREGLTVLLNAYTNRPYDACAQFADRSGIDWTRMGRQIFFWGNHSNGFTEWINKRQLPLNLYPDNVPLNLHIKRDIEKEFDLKGEGHLGYGNLGATEFEKACMVFGLFALGLAESDHQAH